MAYLYLLSVIIWHHGFNGLGHHNSAKRARQGREPGGAVRFKRFAYAGRFSRWKEGDKTEPIKLISFKVPNDATTIRIKPISDAHLGNVFCSVRELRNEVAKIADTPNEYVILPGDWLELTTKNSVGDIWGQNLTPWQQIELAAEILRPVKDRILCACDGNHELRAYKYDGLMPMRSILGHLGFTQEEVDAKHSASGMLLFVNMAIENYGQRRTTFTLYSRHGSGGGRRMGGKANKMEDMKQEVLADIYILSHTHQQMAFPTGTMIALPDPSPHMTLMKHLHVNSGSFLSWGGYAVQYGFPPSVTGCPFIEMHAYRQGNETVRSSWTPVGI
jgi:predicted MPP superfamily phosphohydrolase